MIGSGAALGRERRWREPREEHKDAVHWQTCSNLTIFNRLGHLDNTVRLSELLSPARIRVPLTASDKEGVLRELADLVGNGGQTEEVLGAILELERQFPTGIGYGVAVPHGKTPALSSLVVVAGTTPAPVPYETIDGQPVRLFFLLAGPRAAGGGAVEGARRAP